jgi:NAD kinase
MTEHKIVIVTRKTRLAEIIARFNTIEQAKFYIEQLGSDFKDYQAEDLVYKKAILEVEINLRKVGKVQIIDRSFLPNFIFGKKDIVVVVGQDGLVVNTMKYLDHQPLVAINSDPERWDGVLLPFRVCDALKIIIELVNYKRSFKEISFAQVELNNGQQMYAVNDLFIGPKSHTSAQYILEFDEKSEKQSSSGIIISTGLGSTGWLRSILTGAKAITNKNSFHEDIVFDWDAKYLYYTVREPFPSNATSTDLIFGQITQSNTLTLTSLMANNGVIFSDGIEADYLEFNSGMIAKVGVADKRGILVI